MANNNSPEAMAKILVQVKKHADWMRRRIDEIKLRRLEERLKEKWTESRGQPKNEESNVTNIRDADSELIISSIRHRG